MKSFQILLLLSFLATRMTAFLPFSPQRDSFLHLPLNKQTKVTCLSLSLKKSGANPPEKCDSHSDSSPARPTQKRRRKALRSLWFRTMVATTLFFRSLTGAPPLAQAKFSYELSEKPTYSLRPGMSSEQAQMLIKGESSIELIVPTTTPDATPSSSTAPKSSSKESLYGDYTDEDDDDFADAALAPSAPVIDRRLMGGRSTVPEAPKGRTQQFAAHHQGKSTILYAKVAACLFVPTFGGMFLREYIRRQKEEEYVKKGLAILEQQKREYFNITSTDDEDADDDDANKKNGTDTSEGDDNTEDDDEDDDDDDDDSPPPPSSRGRPGPKRPGPRGGDDKGSSGSDGSGKPSDEDLDKLNQLFRKS